MLSRILVVDDDPLIRGSFYEQLKGQRFDVEVAESGDQALDLLRQGKFHLVLADWKMPGWNGMELLDEVKSRYSQVQVVIMTGFGSMDLAVEAFRRGAFDFLPKPIQPDQLQEILQRVLATSASAPTSLDKNEEAVAEPFEGLIGEHPSIQELKEIVLRVAPRPATVLLEGESGTGKRLIAQAIHRSDPNRRDRPFVEVSCGALPETLLESELFGHVRGAFTGAIRDKKGRFELADGGTILLDEVDTFSPAMQVKLLRVLQERTFERVGESRTLRVDVRIIAATNQSLESLVREGKFREDLFYRLNVVTLRIPPLRDRGSDITLLVDYFLRQAGARMGKPVTGVTEEAMAALLRHRWPGNARELENAIERAVILAQGEFLTLRDLPEVLKGQPARDAAEPERPDRKSGTLKEALRNPEREIILQALKESGFNRSLAAKRLGIHRATLYHKLRLLSIEPDRLRYDAIERSP